MVLEIFLIYYTAEIFSLIILLVTMLYSYKLMIKDKKASWNFISMAIAFLAISVGFSTIDRVIKMNIFDILEHLTMMLSALMFAGILSIAKKQGDGLK